jgi:hypothetical protein
VEGESLVSLRDAAHRIQASSEERVLATTELLSRRSSLGIAIEASEAHVYDRLPFLGEHGRLNL